MNIILLVFLKLGFEAVMGGILDRWDLDFESNSWEGRSESRFHRN